ncbi:MAG: glycine dehydrogenase (aminomethyl-transferring) [Candidatus Neomarinimicrobiota bacterium]|nr:MAG: glycine dehydrogenase (aminomethyl-transferring) [Candidatus Neomarinimicrobiota bacterium]
MKNRPALAHDFLSRHLGPDDQERDRMVRALGWDSLDAFIDQVVPAAIRTQTPLRGPEAVDEGEILQELRSLAGQNRLLKSLIGCGYYGTHTPAVILRNILENPGWYTQYTPYQAEISQGRLEALMNFQTMVADLTALPIANASLLDEATAAAEAMTMFHRGAKVHRFLVDTRVHPQTQAVLETRSAPQGIVLDSWDPEQDGIPEDAFGLLLQYPATDGVIRDVRAVIAAARERKVRVVLATDLLALTVLEAPGTLGADAAVGSSQRFGVPLGYGGPHAAFMAVTEEFKRKIPGRIIGLSRDRHGRPAYRMALQAREQHIRRDRATSNICTAQVLLAIMAGMYAVWHGPEGLRRIGRRVAAYTRFLGTCLDRAGYRLESKDYFDTIRFRKTGLDPEELRRRAEAAGYNLRFYGDGSVGCSLDETVTRRDLEALLRLLGVAEPLPADLEERDYTGPLPRSTKYLTHPVFHAVHSETQMLRYIHRLEQRDLALNTSMISLGSCTMKLNGTTEMIPVTWREFADLHPFVPREQARGYGQIFQDLESWLGDITGLPAVSLQPNSGAQGEYTGLRVIREYHRRRGENGRRVCLIPASAHGTNPASAVMAGFTVEVVACDDRGNIDVADLRRRAEAHREDLGALMVTYPSTHGVFEEAIRDICDLIHANGGLVYLDGANLNAMVGLARPGELGADIMHVNLHKTFAIPHGGGGPGMGPVCCTESLRPYLPTHPLVPVGGAEGLPAVSGAPWGSADILLISWVYLKLLGGDGLTEASKVAILNANYMAHRLNDHFPILYRGSTGYAAHEFILDLRPLKKATGISDEDVAKRLMDYGFHAPTMSFPVHGTLMIEPTESEDQAELDRLCDALIAIKGEAERVASGEWDRKDNPLTMAPHTPEEIAAEPWTHPYSREVAVFPAPWTRQAKFWPPVGRIDNAYGDRHLVCTCPPVEDYS